MIQIPSLTESARRHLAFTPLQYMLDAVVENQRLASVFVDDADSPKTCVLVFGLMLFIGGACTDGCFAFVNGTLLQPFSGRYAQVLTGEAAWRDAFSRRFGDKCRPSGYTLLRRNGAVCEGVPPEEIVRVERPEPLENYQMIVDEVIGTATYNDMDDFFRRGVCFSPVIEGKVCGFCTSEFPSRGAVAIGIEVLEAFQRRGYAKAMTRAFLGVAAGKGLTVYWDCYAGNTASRQTALSCGFEKVADYEKLLLILGSS